MKKKGKNTKKHNPFIYGRPVVGDEFLDRENTISDVFSRIYNGESSAITGQPHLGKTSILKRIMDYDVQLNNVDLDILQKWRFSYFSFLDIVDDNAFTLVDFWEKVLEPIKELLSEDIYNEAQKSNFNRVQLRNIFDLLHRQNKQLVFLLDEFECSLFHKNFQSSGFLSALRCFSYDVRGLVLIVSSRLSLEELIVISINIGSPFLNHLIDCKLSPFDQITIDLLIKKGNFSNEDSKYIQKVAGPNPYLLQALSGTLYDAYLANPNYHVENITEEFYNRIESHFRDLWDNIDDDMRTVAVILSLQLLDGRALGSTFNYGEIERVDIFSKELIKLQKMGLAILLEKSNNGWIFDSKSLLVWRGEKWTIGSEAFSWWIIQNIIAPSRKIPNYEKWLYDKKYLTIITQQQWDSIQKMISKIPSWVSKGISGLAHSLWSELNNK